MDFLRQHFQHMVKFFQPRPEPSGEFYEKWRGKMSAYDIEDVAIMVDHIESHKRQFPSLDECIATVDSLAFNRRKNETETRRTEQKQREQWYDAVKDDYGKKSVNLIRQLLSGKISRRQYVEGCEALGQDMRTLRQYYKKWSLREDET